MSKARRGHQEGGITARKNTHGEVISYLAQVRIPGGGRRSELLKTEQEARRWIRKTHADLASGRLTARRPPTLAEYLEKTWLPTIAGAVGSRTLASYTLNVKRLTPALGRVRMDELRPAHFQDFYHALTASGRAPRTVRQIHRTYHKALKDGLRLDLVARNPTEGVSLPRIPHAEPRWYTGEELAQLLDAAQEDRFHALWYVLGTLGLRLSEALGLNWTDVDWSRNTITVQRSLQRDRFGGGLVLRETKTKRSRRTLTLSSDTRGALLSHKDRQDFERKRAGPIWTDHALIFCSELGTPHDQNKAWVHWKAVCATAGLPRYRIHDLRHTWASLQLMGGTPVERLAAMGGWSSVAMLFEVYGHIIPADFRDGTAVMDDILARARAQR